MLKIIHRRVPGVQLNRSDLDQAEQPFKIINPQPSAFAALPLLESVSLSLANGNAGFSAICTATGTLDTLG